MKVLVIKTSSLGDVIHTLPALTDAAAAIPGVGFDWVVEEAFAEVPAWHPAVRRVIPIALRRWRRAIRKALTGGEVAAFVDALRSQRYDCVVDAQGLLIKSALVALLARGARSGFDRKSTGCGSCFPRHWVIRWRKANRITAFPDGRECRPASRRGWCFSTAPPGPASTGPSPTGWSSPA